MCIRDRSFSIQKHQKIGLVGDNGAGKSTLVKLLEGKLTPDSGEIAKARDVELSYLNQETNIEDCKDVITYILSGLKRWKKAHDAYESLCKDIADGNSPTDKQLEMQSSLAQDIESLGGWNPERFAENVASKLGITLGSTPIDKLSGGEKRRIALARALVSNADLLILDEPTNHLDIETIEWLEGYLKNEFKGAVLLITHDRYVLDSVVDKTLEIDGGKIYSYDGGWESYLEGKAIRLEQSSREESNRLNKLRRELDWLRRSPKARSTKQKARVQRAESLRDNSPKQRAGKIKSIKVNTSQTGKDVAVLEHIDLAFETKTILQDFSLLIKKGDRIGIMGKNGAGKTTLLRLLTEELKPSAGKVKIGVRTKFNLFSQHRDVLDLDKSLLGFIADNRDTIEIAGQTMHATAYLASYQFGPEKHSQKIRTLSGGERARLALAKFLLDDGNVFLLDEPTNDLDVSTLGSVESMLVETNATVVVVTHDRYFLDKVANSILAFEGDGKVTRYESYQQAIALSKAPPASPQGQTNKPKIEKSDSEPKKPSKKDAKGLTFTEQHEFKDIDKKIEAAEKKVTAINTALADPSLYQTDKASFEELQKSLATSELELSELMSRWEYLATKDSAT